MKRWMGYLGIFLISLGVITLVENIWHLNIWAYLWPVILIAFGVWLLVRPPGRPFWIWWADDSSFTGEWKNEGNLKEHHVFVGETTLDLSTEENLIDGVKYSFNGFAGEIKIYVPDDVGVKVRANYYGGSIVMFGEEMTGVMAPIEDQTPHFESAPRKAFIEVNYFAGETKIIRLNERL